MSTMISSAVSAALTYLRKFGSRKNLSLLGISFAVVVVSNPEILSLVAIVSVIGIDAFFMLVLWQLRDLMMPVRFYAQLLWAKCRGLLGRIGG
jgi:hypothetical protein